MDVDIAPRIPAGGTVRLVEYGGKGGKVLTFEPSDVESVIDVSIGYDVHELPSDDGTVHRELGQQTVTLVIRMRPDARALWVDKEQDNGR